jgi:ABC-type uncharacterized transport system permease subunit
VLVEVAQKVDERLGVIGAGLDGKTIAASLLSYLYARAAADIDSRDQVK